MKTELVAIDSLSPDPANARKHGERNLKSIIDSLRAFGQQKPIVVDARGVVIAGNGTLEAARRIGWDEIAIVRSELKPTEATAFGIADNRTAELAEWDEEVLASLLDSLDDETRGLLAFTDEELGAFNIAEASLPDLEDKDREPFQSMAFQLHDEQAKVVEDAIALARKNGKASSDLNENGKANCLAEICREYLGA